MLTRDPLCGGLVCAEIRRLGRRGVRVLGFTVDSDSARKYRTGLTGPLRHPVVRRRSSPYRPNRVLNVWPYVVGVPS
jgi:hypothetical protein